MDSLCNTSTKNKLFVFLSFLDSQNYHTEVDEDDLETADENFCKDRGYGVVD